jgi:hypothetical protein
MRVVYHNYDPTGVVLNLVLGWIRLIVSGFRLDWIGCLVGFFSRIGLLVLGFFKIGFITGRFWD